MARKKAVGMAEDVYENYAIVSGKRLTLFWTDAGQYLKMDRPGEAVGGGPVQAYPD